MRLFLVSVLIFLLPSVCISQQYKQQVMLIVKFVGLEDESDQKIIKNHLEAELSNFFELKSEQEVKQAMVAATLKADSEFCTEEECRKIMGKMLDVDFEIYFEIIATDQEWSIKGNRTDTFEGTKEVNNKICPLCTPEKARQEISVMVSSMNPSKTMTSGMATVSFETTPSAQLFIDGELMGTTPIVINVKAGVTIEYYLVAEGYSEIRYPLTPKQGKNKKIKVTLARKRGKIRVLSTPTQATVFLDGKLKRSSDGSEEKTPVDLRPTFGRHKLLLKKDKYKDFETTIEINKLKHEDVRFSLDPKPGKLVITVPTANRNAQIFANDRFLGRMGGMSTKSFEAPANESLEVYAKDGQAVSLNKTVKIEPDGSEVLIFYALEVPKGFQVNLGAALALDYFTYELDTANDKISSSYNLIGFELHGVLLPSRYRVTISSFSGDGEFTNQTTPFYIVVKNQLFPIEKTSASILRVLVTPEWQPGWIYSIGYERSTLSYSGGSGTLNSKRNSLCIEGGYESSEFFDFMIDNDLFQETKLRYSTATGLGFNVSLGGIFF